MSSANASIPSNSTFKSSLPPRKRAKTQEEKEQRRIERILRNRRAAHASREKKRKHVEFLENYVLKLEKTIATLQKNESNLVGKLTDLNYNVDDLKLIKIDDLNELKLKFEKNNSSNDDDMDDDVEEHEDVEVEEPEQEEELKHKLKKEKNELTETNLELNESSNKSSLNPVSVKQENELFVYNYLSPISIQSPIQSPYNLTLETNEITSNLASSTQNSRSFSNLSDYSSLSENSEISDLSLLSNTSIINENLGLNLNSKSMTSNFNQFQSFNDYDMQNSEVILRISTFFRKILVV